MKIKRWMSILCCVAMMFTILGSNTSAAVLWNQNVKGIIAAAETAEGSTVTLQSVETEIELNDVYIVKKDTVTVLDTLEPLESDPTVFVASEGNTSSLKKAILTGSFSSSSKITISVSNSVYQENVGLWTVTKQPKENNGKFEITINDSFDGAVALELNAVATDKTEKTYTLVFERRKSCLDLEKISLLSSDEYVEVGDALEFSSVSSDTSRIIYCVDEDTSPLVVQVSRNIDEWNETATDLKWMMADENYISLNSGTPARFDGVSSNNPEACSPELNLKTGVNIISLFLRNSYPRSLPFNYTGNTDASRGLYLSDSDKNLGYTNFVYLVVYEGEESEADDPTDDVFLSSIGVTQFTASTTTNQVAYPSKLTEGGYEHSIALPESMPAIEDTRDYYYEDNDENNAKTYITHEDIVLELKTDDPYAKAEVVDARIYAPNNATIYGEHMTATKASISIIDGTYGEYTAVNVWDKNEIQVKVTAADGSERIHTINIIRASSDALVTGLSVSGGSLALEDSGEVDFLSETYTYYLDTTQEIIDNQALSFTVSFSSGASITIDDDEGVQAGIVQLDASLPMHKIVVTAADGITQSTYLFLARVDGEVPFFELTDVTKTDAEEMLDGWNSRTDYEKKDMSDSYWELYKTIATMDPVSLNTQKDVQKAISGSYVYDVTKHNFRQATDYAAVILELVMLGENPYDYQDTNYVECLLDEEDEDDKGNFGAWGNNVWALIGLKAAGAEIPDELIDSVKSQTMNSSGDLDLRGWAIAAAAEYMEPLEIAECAQSIKDTQLTSGDDAGMFKHPSYNTVNTMTHGCVLTGIAGAGIDVQNQLYMVDGTITPLNVLKKNYMTEDGQFYYSSVGFESYNKDVIIALGDIIHGSNVWQRYELTAEKFEGLLSSAKTMAAGSNGSNDERDAVSSALKKAQTAASTSGGAITALGDEYYALYEAMSAIDTDMKADVTMGSPLKQFNEMIQALPDPEEITQADKEELEEAIDYFESLADDYQKGVGSDILTKYRECQSALILLGSGTEAEHVFTLILALPDALIITLDDEDQVEEARKAYDALTSDQQAWITWAGATVLSTLTEAEEMIDALDGSGGGSTVETTTVTFSLLGGSKHNSSKTVYIYSKNPGKFDVWIPETTYTFNSSSVTVYKVFLRAISEYELDQKGAANNYVSSILGPDGEWLSECDNGDNSGWMYMVNGTHPSVGLKDCNISDGDEIIWHYTDDYTKEEGSEHYTSNSDPDSSSTISETISLQAVTSAAGRASVSVSAGYILSALTKVLEAVELEEDENKNVIAEVKLDIKADSSVKFVETTIPTSSVKEIVKAGNTLLTVVTPVGNITFEQNALSAILETAAGRDITISVGKADKSKLSATQQHAVADRPVFELRLTSGAQVITDFNGGTVSVSLPYALASEEQVENICIYYLNESGQLIQVEDAKYDENSGSVNFTTDHFSYYIIGNETGNRFTDVKSGHWYYENIMYLAGKKIINGKTETTFSPNDRITRAEFTQILYGMALAEERMPRSAVTVEAVAVDGIKAVNAFSDVKKSEWYAKAVEWAYENGVITGIENHDGTLSFMPNLNISRQDIAVMIKNYTEKVEKKEISVAASVSNSGTAADFADASEIAVYAKEAVTLMQHGGIINGISQKNGSGETITVYSPKAVATRAEAATMIARLLKSL